MIHLIGIVLIGVGTATTILGVGNLLGQKAKEDKRETTVVKDKEDGTSTSDR